MPASRSRCRRQSTTRVPHRLRRKQQLDIHEMGPASDVLLNLRPVTFRYNQDPRGELRYGLIAEEVAQVYPDLVGYGPDGKVQTVRNHELIPMLLNELQKQSRGIARFEIKQEQEFGALEERLAALEQLKHPRHIGDGLREASLSPR
jgi:hypothetical protein